MNSKRMLFLGSILLVAVALWMMASIVGTWISQRRATDALKADASGPSNSRAAVPRQARTMADYSMISEEDVFHAAKGMSQSPMAEGAEIKVTERNLQLKGTVLGEGRSSYAVIVDLDSGKEDIYYPDDFVMGARIAKILKNRVILDSSGMQEALLMSDERAAISELGSSSQPKPASRVTPSPRRGVSPRPGAGGSSQ